jgi:hypothetical protein
MGAFLGGVLQGAAGKMKNKAKGGASSLGNTIRRKIGGIFKKKQTKSLASDDSETGDPSSMKRGGKVRKTGLIKLHRGETVIPKRSRGKS